MFFPFYIARRYLVAKKSHNIINVISAISVAGVAIGAAALIIVLSVFNGFDRLVVSLFSTFNSEIRVTPARGKTFDIAAFPLDRIRAIPGVQHVAEVIEEDVLMKYRDNQAIVTIKGVSEEFVQMSGLDSMITDGKFLLQEGDKDYAVLGYGVAATLNASLHDYTDPVSVWVPRRDVSFAGGFEDAFRTEVIFPSGFFQVQYDYDVKFAILPLRFVSHLLDYGNQRTGIEIGLTRGADRERVQQAVARTAGPAFVVKNRFQQQEVLFRVMVSEKNYVFLILTLILVIATFNVIGTLSMLILDKKRDIAVLQSMGAGRRTIRRIFLTEGLLISLLGASAGLVTGAAVCWIQQRFGLIRLGSADSSFIVDAYPVFMKATDFILVFATVMVTGLLAAWYPVYNIGKVNPEDVKLAE